MRQEFSIYLSHLLTSIPNIAILIGCIIYISRVARIDAVLLLIGKALSILVIVANAIVISMQFSGAMPHSYTSKIFTMVHIASLLAGAIFATGFIIMAVKQKP